MISKNSIEELMERMDMAKAARCDGEKEAIIYEDMEPGDAECGNCGHAFPPEHAADEDSLIWCSNYEKHHALTFCKAWKHPANHSAGIHPPWAAPYTRKRVGLTELSDEETLKAMDDAVPRPPY